MNQSVAVDHQRSLKASTISLTVIYAWRIDAMVLYEDSHGYHCNYYVPALHALLI